MKKRNETPTDIAIDGYEHTKSTETCVHEENDPAWLAWHFGRWMRRTGRSMPRGVRIEGRYRVLANDMTLVWSGETDIGGPVFTRID